MLIADNADFNIFTLAELFAFRCDYEARLGFPRAAPRNVGKFWCTLWGCRGSEAGQRGLGGAEPHTPDFQRNVWAGTATTPPACSELAWIWLIVFSPGWGALWVFVEMHSGQCAQSLTRCQALGLSLGLGLQQLMF